MTRKEAREFIMQVFFQMESCKDFDVNNREIYFKDKPLDRQRTYCNEMFSLFCNKREAIDAAIEKHSTRWKIERMPKADFAILRVAACEILYCSDIPDAVSINEAVDLAKAYGTEDSPKYINAILGKVSKFKEELEVSDIDA